MLRTRDRRRTSRLGGRDNVVVLAGVGLAAVSTYAAHPLVAPLWAGLAFAGGTAFLVQDRPGRPAAIAALTFAGLGLIWAVVRLAALG